MGFEEKVNNNFYQNLTPLGSGFVWLWFCCKAGTPLGCDTMNFMGGVYFYQ